MLQSQEKKKLAAYTMAEYSTAMTATEDAEYQVLFNPDAVRSEIIDAGDAPQHRLDEARYSPERSARSPARYESVRAPEPEEEQEIVVQENPRLAMMIREYEMLPPPQQKGRRMKVLVDLKRYEKLGFALSQDYTIHSDYVEMVHERDAIIRLKERDNNVKMAGQVFLTFIQGLEWSNSRWDPFGLKLKGLYETTYAHMDDYHEVLGELMDKYSAAGSRVEPEVKLAVLLFGGIFANHSVQKQVEETMLDGTMIERAGKDAAFNQVRKVVMGPRRVQPAQRRPAAHHPAQQSAVHPVARPAAREMAHPASREMAHGVPVGGFPQPGAFAEVKEFNNSEPAASDLEAEQRIEEALKEEMKSMQTPVSMDTQGKPRRRKSGRAIKV